MHGHILLSAGYNISLMAEQCDFFHQSRLLTDKHCLRHMFISAHQTREVARLSGTTDWEEGVCWGGGGGL